MTFRTEEFVVIRVLIILAYLSLLVIYRVICMGSPSKMEGFVKGRVAFQKVRDHNEVLLYFLPINFRSFADSCLSAGTLRFFQYIFVRDGEVGGKAVLWRHPIEGKMNYKVVATEYGCSLIDITFTKCIHLCDS